MTQTESASRPNRWMTPAPLRLRWLAGMGTPVLEVVRGLTLHLQSGPAGQVRCPAAIAVRHADSHGGCEL
jgi:hypothetical protein